MAQGKKQQAAKPAKKAAAAKPKKAAAKAKPSAAAAKAKRPAAAAAKAKKPVARPKAPVKAKKPAVKPKVAAKAKKPVARTAPAKKPAAKAKSTRAAAASKVTRLPHLDEKTLTQIVAKLNEMRAESSRFVNTQVQADLLQREEGGDVGDDMDQASNERDREFSLLLHQRHLRRLKQIEDAFGRIADGSYGLCEGTEEPINPRRLLIMPLARFSLEYQQQQEKMLGRSPEEGPGGGEETMISDE